MTRHLKDHGQYGGEAVSPTVSSLASGEVWLPDRRLGS
jgi:hypothetical protein